MQVFILGTGRSGTSVFNRVIGCHTDIWSFKWESQIFSGFPALVDVVSVEPPVTKLEGLALRFRKYLYRHVVGGGFRTDFPVFLVEKFSSRVRHHLYKRSVDGRYDAGLYEIIDQDELDELLGDLVCQIRRSKNEEDRRRACVRFVNAIFQSAAEKESKLVWCEKTPRNLLYADKIQKMYPDAKFINLIRDGREVASSILERNFWPIAKCSRFKVTRDFSGEVTLPKAVNYWCSLMSITDEMKGRVGAGNWLDIRLEDLGRDMLSVQLEIEKFIGVSHDAGFQSSVSSIVSEKKADKKRWMYNRSESEILFMQKRMSRYLERYGYAI